MIITTTKFLAINGVHTAGKSTMGEMLREKEGFNYRPEIAQRLIDEGEENWADEGDHAFQVAIHDFETDRDRRFLRNGINHVVIETWHFGNMAHSIETARESLVKEQKEYYCVLTDRIADAYAIFLDMPLEKIWVRSPRFERGNDDIIEFYESIRENHFRIYEEQDVDYTIVENDGSLRKAYEEVREFAYEVLDT